MNNQLLVTLIQPNIIWENKEQNIAAYTQKIKSIASNTHIIVLPEMFSTGFSMQPKLLAEKMDGFTVNWMKQIAQEKKCIVTGSVIIEENEKYYNRLIWMLPNGNYGFYDKRHCFSLAGEQEHYTPGNKRLIASVNGWKINVQICYDLRFPVWARQQKQEQPEYDVLLYVANWPERRNHAWKTLLTARAIENQCFVIGVNRVGNDGNNIYHSGDSIVVDALGEVLYTKAHEEDITTVALQKAALIEVREKFKFLNDADAFKIIL
jgi:predicted amidohydrolase